LAQVFSRISIWPGRGVSPLALEWVCSFRAMSRLGGAARPMLVLHRSQHTIHPEHATDKKIDFAAAAEDRKGKGHDCEPHTRYKHLHKPDEIEALSGKNSKAVHLVLLQAEALTSEKHDAWFPQGRDAHSHRAKYTPLDDEGDVPNSARKTRGDDSARNKALFAGGLRRANLHDRGQDGSLTLRELIKESEQRIRLVKSQCPGMVYGIEYTGRLKVDPDSKKVTALSDHLQPDRSLYPAESERKRLNSAAPGDGGSMSARTPTQVEGLSNRHAGTTTRRAPEPHTSPHCPGRPRRPELYRQRKYVSPITGEMREMPVQLPSLEAFIDQGPGVHDRAESNPPGRAKGAWGVGSKANAKWRKAFEKSMWEKEEEGWNRIVAEKRAQGWLPGTIKEDSGRVREVFPCTDDPRKKNPDESIAEQNDTGTKGIDEGGGVYRKILELMTETDHAISPVARLRDTLTSYQKTREEKRQHLQESLYSMDADRLNALRRRAEWLQPGSHGPTADPKNGVQLMRLRAEREMLKQHYNNLDQLAWYESLLATIKHSKRDLPDVAHFMFDYIQQVLEQGQPFTREMFFSMLSQISNDEFRPRGETSPVLAALLFSMVETGLDGLQPNDLREWFLRERGEVPDSILERIEGGIHSGAQPTEEYSARRPSKG